MEAQEGFFAGREKGDMHWGEIRKNCIVKFLFFKR